MRVGGRCQVGGRRGLDTSCDTEYGERLCTPFSPAGRGCGARRPAAHLPTPQQRLAQVPLPPSPPPGSEGRRGKEATSGRGLTGRCRPRSPRAALSDRPGNRGPIPPAGARRGAPRARALRGRDASLPPSRGTLRPTARGHEPFGGTGRGLPAWEGLPLPRRPGDSLAAERGVHCRPRARGVVSRPPDALGGSGQGRTAPLSFPCPPAGWGRAAAGRARSLSCGATALGGIVELLGIKP